MKVKNIIITIAIALVAFIPGLRVSAKEPVKVYIFEAGGCPYCEAQLEYLEGLDGYGTKFEIVRKELYVDHIDWEIGADYELGYEVAKTFYNAGFEDASYQGTPFVVISDIYAATTYSDDLESYINEAYEKQYSDAVACIANGGSDCIKNHEEARMYVYITLAVVIVSVITALGMAKAKVN